MNQEFNPQDPSFSTSSKDPSGPSASHAPSSDPIPNPKRSNRARILRLTQLAMLTAIIILMAFTPVGYLKVGPLSITFLAIPVVLGAVLMGPLDGAILGAVFGATSFIQCFGLDAFGTMLLTANPIYTFLLCFVPRILIGLFSGYLMKGLQKLRANQAVSYALSALAGALTNTVFFVGLLLLFFGNSEVIKVLGDSIPAIIAVLVTTNSLVEAVACTVLVTILAKALGIVLKKVRA